MVFRDIGGWQFLAIEAAETLCMACLPHIFFKNIRVIDLSKITFFKELTIKFAFLRIF